MLSLRLKDTSAANNDDTSNHSQIDVNQMTGTQLISAGDAHAMHLFLFLSLFNESFFAVSTCPIVAPLPACQFRDEVLAAYNTTAADTTRHQEKLRAQPADPQGPLGTHLRFPRHFVSYFSFTAAVRLVFLVPQRHTFLVVLLFQSDENDMLFFLNHQLARFLVHIPVPGFLAPQRSIWIVEMPNCWNSSSLPDRPCTPKALQGITHDLRI